MPYRYDGISIGRHMSPVILLMRRAGGGSILFLDMPHIGRGASSTEATQDL